MQEIKEPDLIFYKKVGELFFAIAAADKIVREEEYDRLRKLVRSHWKNLEYINDGFGTNAAHQIETIFEWFEQEQANAKECYEGFRDYYEAHPKLFTYKRKKLILETANTIANSFAGKNKAELIMLAKLKLLLEEGR